MKNKKNGGIFPFLLVIIGILINFFAGSIGDVPFLWLIQIVGLCFIAAGILLYMRSRFYKYHFHVDDEHLYVSVGVGSRQSFLAVISFDNIICCADSELSVEIKEKYDIKKYETFINEMKNEQAWILIYREKEINNGFYFYPDENIRKKLEHLYLTNVE